MPPLYFERTPEAIIRPLPAKCSKRASICEGMHTYFIRFSSESRETAKGVSGFEVVFV